MPQIRDITRPIRILLADDQPLIRRAVRDILESTPRFRICGEASTGVEAVHASSALNPDVIVLNISMPEMNGFDAARLIRSRHSDAAIVILSSHKDQQLIEEGRRIGVQGFVAKEDAGEELVEAIESAEIGEGLTVAK